MSKDQITITTQKVERATDTIIRIYDEVEKNGEYLNNEKNMEELSDALLNLQNISKEPDFNSNSDKYFDKFSLEQMEKYEQVLDGQQNQTNKFYSPAAAGYMNYYDTDPDIQMNNRFYETRGPLRTTVKVANQRLDNIYLDNNASDQVAESLLSASKATTAEVLEAAQRPKKINMTNNRNALVEGTKNKKVKSRLIEAITDNNISSKMADNPLHSETSKYDKNQGLYTAQAPKKINIANSRNALVEGTKNKKVKSNLIEAITRYKEENEAKEIVRNLKETPERVAAREVINKLNEKAPLMITNFAHNQERRIESITQNPAIKHEQLPTFPKTMAEGLFQDEKKMVASKPVLKEAEPTVPLMITNYPHNKEKEIENIPPVVINPVVTQEPIVQEKQQIKTDTPRAKSPNSVIDRPSSPKIESNLAADKLPIRVKDMVAAIKVVKTSDITTQDSKPRVGKLGNVYNPQGKTTEVVASPSQTPKPGKLNMAERWNPKSQGGQGH